jgi:tetratricopeptide (TPR) repeat protein
MLLASVMPGGLTAPLSAQSIGQEVRRFRVYPHLDRAYRLIEHHQMVDARHELETCLAIDRDDVTVWVTYLDVLYQLKDYDSILDRLSGLGDLGRDTRLRRYHLLAELERPDTSAALDDLRALAGLHPSQGGIAKSQMQRVAVRFAALARERRQPELLVALLAVLPEQALPAGALDEVANALRALGRSTDASRVYEHIARTSETAKPRLEAYRALASMAIDQQQWTRAREFLSQVHQLQPADLSSLRSLGDVAAAQGNWPETVRWYRRWLRAASPGATDDRYRAYMVIGKAERELGRHASAAESFSLALRARPGDVAALMADAEALQRVGRTTAAERRLLEALRVAPTGNAHAEVGLFYARSGKHPEALPYLERARDLRVSPSLAPSLLGQLGYTYAALNRPDAARVAFTEALQASPNQPVIDAALGHACLALGDTLSAIKHFEHSLEVHDDPQVWRALGLAYAEAGDDAGVGRALNRLRMVKDADRLMDSDFWRQLAEAAFQRGRFEEASTLFRRASASGGDQRWQTMARAADSLERAGALSEAAGIWQELAASRQAPDDLRATAAEQGAYAQVRLGATDAAQASFLLAIRMGHDGWRLHLDRALALSQARRWQDALDEALASLARHDTARGQVAAAVCFKALDKPGLAMRHFARSLDHAGELEQADQKYVLDELTYLYANEGNDEEASASATRSLTIANDPQIVLQLAQIDRRLGRSDRARDLLGTIDSPSLPKSLRLAVLDERVQVDVELGERAEAARMLEEAVALEPSADRLFQLGTCYRELGNLEAAIAFWRRSVAAAPNDVRYGAALGYGYLQAGRLRDAAGLLEQVARQEPENLQVRQDLAYALVRLGDEPGAIQWLRQTIDAATSDSESADSELRRQAVLRMRTTLSQLEKRYEGVAYFGYQTFVAPNSVSPGSALLLSQGGLELSRSLSGAQPRFSVFGRLMAVSNEPTSGLRTAGTFDELGIGIRYKPFSTENLNVSAERLMPIASGLPGSWLLRAMFSREHTLPRQGWQPYSFVYGDVASFIGPYPSLLLYGESRLGVSRDLTSSWTIRPHILAVARVQPAGLGGGDAFQLAAGVGMTYFLEGPSAAHRASLETRIYGSGALAGASGAGRLDGIKGLTVMTSVGF